MPTQLAEKIDLWRLVRYERLLVGTLSTRGMDRLAEVAEELADTVFVELALGRQAETEGAMVGKASTRLMQICERCLEPCWMQLEAKIGLQLVVSEDQARDALGELEPLVVNEDSVNLVGLIEDELLLALPLFAYHDHGKCNAADVPGGKPGDNGNNEQGRRPFAVLKNMRKDG